MKEWKREGDQITADPHEVACSSGESKQIYSESRGEAFQPEEQSMLFPKPTGRWGASERSAALTSSRRLISLNWRLAKDSGFVKMQQLLVFLISPSDSFTQTRLTSLFMWFRGAGVSLMLRIIWFYMHFCASSWILFHSGGIFHSRPHATCLFARAL